MKKILIINGHPKKESFSTSIVTQYVKGAKESSAEVREINVRDMSLEKYLSQGYVGGEQAGEEILQAQNDISWAEHIVFVHPVWWGSTPAILKSFIDMVFAHGFAFKYSKESMTPLKLLKGRTGHIITTLDTPWIIYKYFYGAPSINQLKSRTLEFCGITPVQVTHFGPVHSSSDESRKNFLNKVYLLGKQLA